MRSKAELKALSSSAADLRRALEQNVLRGDNERESFQREGQRLFAREKEIVQANTSLGRELEDLRSRCRLVERELETTKRENEQLAKGLSSMEARKADCDRKEMAAYQQMKEAVEMVEQAKIERDQAMEKEQQAVRDVVRVNDRLRQQSAEAQSRLDTEMAVLRQQHKVQLDGCTAEIAKLESALNDSRAKLDRANRDKKTLESELEKLTMKLPADQARYQSELMSMRDRVDRMEKEREAAVADAESAKTILARKQNQWQQDAMLLQTQLSDSARKLEETRRELEELKAERVKLTSAVDELQRNGEGTRKQREGVEKKAAQQNEAVVRRLEAQIRDLEGRLQDSYSAHHASSKEFNGLLSQHDKMASKWKEELRSSKARFERTVQELKADLVRQAARNEELGARLSTALIERSDMQSQLEEAEKNVRQLRTAVASFEARVAELSGQVAQLMASEKALFSERKDLQTQVDILTLERDRSGRQHEQTLRKLDETQRQLTRLQTLDMIHSSRTGPTSDRLLSDPRGRGVDMYEPSVLRETKQMQDVDWLADVIPRHQKARLSKRGDKAAAGGGGGGGGTGNDVPMPTSVTAKQSRRHMRASVPLFAYSGSGAGPGPGRRRDSDDEDSL